MFRLVVKLVLSFLLHIGWDMGLVYASISDHFFDHPVVDYISGSTGGGGIVSFILGEITFIFLILVYAVKPLEKRIYKAVYWSITSIFAIATLYIWFVQPFST